MVKKVLVKIVLFLNKRLLEHFQNLQKIQEMDMLNIFIAIKANLFISQMIIDFLLLEKPLLISL